MATETKWALDFDHCEIAFKVRHLMIAFVKGNFKTFDATIYTDGNDFSTANISVWIEADSINTGNFKRDEHLKSPDFFDVEKHKQIMFTSGGMRPTDTENHWELWGDLTIKGVTNRIVLSVEAGGIIMDPWGNKKVGFTVSGRIKRSDWGLSWNSAVGDSGVMVGDEISINCEIELLNEAARASVLAALEAESKPIAI